MLGRTRPGSIHARSKRLEALTPAADAMNQAQTTRLCHRSVSVIVVGRTLALEGWSTASPDLVEVLPACGALGLRPPHPSARDSLPACVVAPPCFIGAPRDDRSVDPSLIGTPTASEHWCATYLFPLVNGLCHSPVFTSQPV